MVMGDMETYTDLLVIGSGPGGYSCAFRGADLGLDVTMVDPAVHPGGNYLHANCIPLTTLLQLTKILEDTQAATQKGLLFSPPQIDLKAIRAWKDQIVQSIADNLIDLAHKRGVQMIKGVAKFENSTTVRLTGAEISRIRFKHAIITTGARAISLQNLPFVEDSRIMNPAGALKLLDLPSSLLVVGGGPTGLEIGSLYARLGSRVTLAEQENQLLASVDRDLVLPLEKQLAKLFTDIRLNTQVSIVRELSKEVEVIFKHGNDLKNHRFDRVLVAIGRSAKNGDLGLEKTDVSVDDHGFILVNSSQQTSDRHIFAAGDSTGEPMLAHKAIRAGRIAAEVIAGNSAVFDVQAVPVVINTHPQVCWCGLTEQQAATESTACLVQKFSWQESVRAQPMDLINGLTKLLIDPQNGRILGVGLCGPESGSLITEAALAIEMGALAEDLALMLHPHPTISATYGETAELFMGNSAHILSSRTRE